MGAEPGVAVSGRKAIVAGADLRVAFLNPCTVKIRGLEKQFGGLKVTHALFAED